ncbi:precorrin-8X methylmutase [Geminocystis sp. NIES-3709]|uniref:precorrin-8X methylmutase n=1 Tax=Geminocystis sp. NIES-3709 TaxID=1617448 RepID=UPI0005FC98C3|nr:precorrin-8X methylmutase [Geminocystis sp. NIES-3709]BAQ66649.1 cobalt-precorrin-8x methylmutase [Geminocystis sp. NIES-3709]
MEWNLLTAQNLAIIDKEVGNRNFSCAEYEIVRRVICATGDLNYYSLVNFSANALKSSVEALNDRVPIIVDAAVIQTGILYSLQQTFLNPIYCLEDISIPISLRQKKSWLLQHLSLRYTSPIYIIGQSSGVLITLLDLMESQSIQPSLIIATPSGFIRKELTNNRLKESSVAHIRIDSSKGGVNLAIAIFTGLVDLAWIGKQLTIRN